MSEAEDVLIDLAERASAPLRALWRRSLGPSPEGDRGLEALRLEISVFLVAVFGRAWPLHALSPVPVQGAMLRRISARVRRAEADAVTPYTDGCGIYLGSAAGGPGDDPDVVRRELCCAALALAARSERGSLRWLPDDRLARDLFWIADARAAETCVTDALPGLAREFLLCRQRAARARPLPVRSSPLERRVEAHLRAELGRTGPCRVDAAELARDAEETAAHWRADLGRRATYRGIAPAFCWGRPRRALDPSVRGAELGGTPRALPARNVRASPEAPRDPGDAAPRGAPLLIPPGDPHGSVAPAGRVAPPEDGGDEDLDSLAEELDRLRKVTRVRSNRPVKEILESEASHAAGARGPRNGDPGPEARTRAYPEWDFRNSSYRRGYCIVHAAVAADGDPAWAAHVRSAHRPLVRRLRRYAQQLRPRLEHRPRERHGSEVDLESYVEGHAEWRACGSQNERLYVDQRRRRRDLAVALLIDASASTDRFIDARRRVIDVEREAALLFCEAASAVGDRYAVMAFSGTGPAGVRVAELKSFSEIHGERVALRIAGLEPQSFTRIGGALRHVAADLARVPARHHLLLLLSDGAPNDDDEYEGRYGVEDTRRAVAELRVLGVRPFCVTIEPRQTAQVARMFGRSGYATLRDLRRLPEHLAGVYRQVARG